MIFYFWSRRCFNDFRNFWRWSVVSSFGSSSSLMLSVLPLNVSPCGDFSNRFGLLTFSRFRVTYIWNLSWAVSNTKPSVWVSGGIGNSLGWLNQRIQAKSIGQFGFLEVIAVYTGSFFDKWLKLGSCKLDLSLYFHHHLHLGDHCSGTFDNVELHSPWTSGDKLALFELTELFSSGDSCHLAEDFQL